MKYLMPEGIPCRYRVGDATIVGKLPPGWYEHIVTNGHEAQLALSDKGFPGQTSRFIVLTSDLRNKRTYPDDSTLVGYLVDGKFRCLSCHASAESNEGEQASRMYGVNLRPYSQSCSVCRGLIVHGTETEGKPCELFPS